VSSVHIDPAVEVLLKAIFEADRLTLFGGVDPDLDKALLREPVVHLFLNSTVVDVDLHAQKREVQNSVM
jgi:hypothetical protein